MSLREGLSSAAVASDSSLAPFFTPADRHAGALAMPSAAISLSAEHAAASAGDAAQCGQYATLARAQPEAQRAVDIATSATSTATQATNGEPADGSGSADGPCAAASHTSPAAANGSATTHTYATVTTATTAQAVVATVQTEQAQAIGTQADALECAQPQCSAPTAAEPPAAAFNSPSNAATPARSRAKAGFAAEPSQTADRARSAPASNRVLNAISGTSRCPSPGGKSAVAAYVAEHGAAITRASAPAWLYDDASDVAGHPQATSLVGLPLMRAGSSGAALAVLATAQRRTQSASPGRSSHERAHELDCFGAGLLVSRDASPASSPRATQLRNVASRSEPVPSPRSPARRNRIEVSSSGRGQQPQLVDASRDAGTAAGKQHDDASLISLEAAASTPAHTATADGLLSATPQLFDSPCSSPTAFAKCEAHSAAGAVPAPAAARQDADAVKGADPVAIKRPLAALSSLQEVPVDTSEAVVAAGGGDVGVPAGEAAHGASGINRAHVATSHAGSDPVDALRSLQEVSVDVDGCGGRTSPSSPSSVGEAAAAAAAALEHREDACLSASALAMSELHTEADIAVAAVNAGGIESSVSTDSASPEFSAEAQQRCPPAQQDEQQGDSRTLSGSGTAAELAPPQRHACGADGVAQAQAQGVQHGGTPLQRSALLVAQLVGSESIGSGAAEADSIAEIEHQAHNAAEVQHRDQATATPHHVAVQTDADEGAGVALVSVQAGTREAADVTTELSPMLSSANSILAASAAEQKEEEPATPDPAVSAAARAITAELDRLLSALRRERAPALQLRSVPRPLSAPPAAPLDAPEATTLVDQGKPDALTSPNDAIAGRSSSAQPAPRQHARARLPVAGLRSGADAHPGTDSPSCLQFTYSRSPGRESVDFIVDGKSVLPFEQVSCATPAHNNRTSTPLLNEVTERDAPRPAKHPDADQSGSPTAPTAHKATATPYPSSAAAGTQTPDQPATTAHIATSSLSRQDQEEAEHQQRLTLRAASPAPAIAPATATLASADSRPSSPLRTSSNPATPTAPALADPHVVEPTRGITASTQTLAQQPAAQSEVRGAAAAHATTDQPAPTAAPSSLLSSLQRTSPTQAPSADALQKAAARYPALFPSLSLPAVRTPATATPRPPAQAITAPTTSTSPVASSRAASPLGRGVGLARSASAAPRYCPAWGSALSSGILAPATGAVPAPASAGVDNEVGAAASAVPADAAEADDKANNGEGVISITGYNFASIQLSCATRALVSTKRGAGYISITENGEAAAPGTQAAAPPAATGLAVDASLQGWHSSADCAGLEETSYSQVAGAVHAAPLEQLSHGILPTQQAHAQPVRAIPYSTLNRSVVLVLFS